MPQKKVLIVEDNSIIALDLKAMMNKFGFYVTDMVSTFKSVMDSIQKNQPNIILMDINLGKDQKDGIEITKEIKKTKDIPVLYLTAFSDDKTMQRAFDTIPVGYLIKPFKKEEVKASIMLALYKINKQKYTHINQDHTYIGFDYYFDIQNKKLYYKSQFIKLGEKEKHLISILLRSKNKFISNDELEHKLWRDKVPSNSSLRTLIYRIKIKLGCQIITGSYSNGYKLNYKV